MKCICRPKIPAGESADVIEEMNEAGGRDTDSNLCSVVFPVMCMCGRTGGRGEGEFRPSQKEICLMLLDYSVLSEAILQQQTERVDSRYCPLETAAL